jgi:SAM-dependent methyltransferase
MAAGTTPISVGRDEFSGEQSEDGYWRSAEADHAMQRGNACAWEAMGEAEKHRLSGASVLDVGCNKGGFLRFLYDRYDLGNAYGFDPADGAITEARALNGDRRIEYDAASRPPERWHGVDIAFSQEVVYLVEDLAEHADDLWRALRPGGFYTAVTSVHAQSRLMAPWHAANADALQLPPLRRVEDYLAPFLERGFSAEVARLQIRAVPIDAELLDRTWDLLEFWTRTNDKVVFRLEKPASASPTG